MTTHHTTSGAPGSLNTGATPNRQDSLTSPIPEERGDLANLLLERLDAWKHATGYLEEYVEATAHLHKGLSKDYDKIIKSVNEPLREGHHFAQNTGGIASFFENIRQNTQAIANSQLETEKHLKGNVLQALNRLHAEIKNKHKELSGGAAKGSKAVDKARGLTQKQIEHLGQQTASFESAGGRLEPTQDPYIIQRGVQHHLHRQILEENANNKDLIDVQNNFLTFEKHVIETLQGAMAQFFQVVGGQADKTKQLYGDITANVQNVPAEFEWTNFLGRNGDVLVDPKAPPRSLDTIRFPNQDHRSTQPLVSGLLGRKGKIMKSYDTYHYAVTPAGYFHEFSQQNDFKEHPEPESSLYLPECAIGAAPQPGEAKIIISGKDATKNQHLTQKHDFVFKANSYDEAMKWYSIMEQFTNGKLTRQNSLSPTSSNTTSPITSHTIGNTQPLDPVTERPITNEYTSAPVDQPISAPYNEKPHAAPINTDVAHNTTMASPSQITPHTAAPHSAAPHSAVPHSAVDSAPSSAAPDSAGEKKKHSFFGLRK